MTKSLIIAEKPSVAQDIVRALTPVAGKFDKHDEYFENERYLVTSAVGHLLEIKAPDDYDVKRGKWSFANLPVIPPHLDLNPIDKSKSRLNAIKSRQSWRPFGPSILAGRSWTGSRKVAFESSLLMAAFSSRFETPWLPVTWGSKARLTWKGSMIWSLKS